MNALMKEVKICLFVSHPHIVKAHCAFEQDAKLFIDNDYCAGGELFRHLLEHKMLPENQVKTVASQLLQAIDFLHRNSIVHRDVKPENILLVQRNSLAAIVLCDFGLAKVFTPGKRMRRMCGTPAYVAPEVLRKNYDQLSDLWSLGVVLFLT